jgi:hypothetical protein
MNFNKHYDLIGKHAFLSPSKYTWLGYSKDQLRQAYVNAMAAVRGTKLHGMAKDLIEEGIKIRGNKQTFAAYVNDAIGYGMTPEQPLYFSDNCFGTADAIYYKDGFLRIHDLKTGTSPVHMEQLEIYAALFLLEYERQLGIRAGRTRTELRIYQNDDVIEDSPDPERIEQIMNDIREKDAWAEEFRGER